MSNFQADVTGVYTEISLPEPNDMKPFHITRNPKDGPKVDVRVYTRRQALFVIGYTGQNAYQSLQMDISKSKVVEICKVRKAGTMVEISLLDADTVDKRAEAYKPGGFRDGKRTFEIRAKPELLAKLITCKPEDMSIEDVKALQVVLREAEDITEKRKVYHAKRNANQKNND